MQFDVDSGNFESRFILDTTIAQPSVLYYNTEYWYPTGFNLTLYKLYKGYEEVLPASAYTLDLSQPNYAKFTIINPALYGQLITV